MKALYKSNYRKSAVLSAASPQVVKAFRSSSSSSVLLPVASIKGELTLFSVAWTPHLWWEAEL